MYAKEFNATGHRLFLVADPAVIVLGIRNNVLTCIYEVIPSGWMCRIFFDLEYKRVDLPARTAAEDDCAVQAIFSTSRQLLLEDCQDVDVAASVVLDASDSSKFSKHLIVASTGPARSISDVQSFVRNVAVRLPALSFLIDLSPYKTNQQFRVPFCSKFGQMRPLLPVPFTVNGSTTLVYTCQSMTPDMFRTSCVSVSKVVKARLPFRSVSGISPGRSPFPKLDAWVAGKFGRVFQVKLDRLFPNSALLFFFVESKFCSNVGREHLSNRVIIAVDVSACQFHQRCLDCDCKGYCSPAIPLDMSLLSPISVLPKFQEWLSIHFPNAV